MNKLDTIKSRNPGDTRTPPGSPPFMNRFGAPQPIAGFWSHLALENSRGTSGSCPVKVGDWDGLR